MADTLRVGLVGVGQRGLQHLDALQRMEGVEIVALCDPFPENLDEAKIRRFVAGFQPGSAHTFTRFDEFLQAGPLDAVYVCIPPGRHNGEVVRAAQAGCHLFVEKPMSLYLEEALAMQRAVETAGVIATVGFQQRYDVRHQAAKTFLADKRLVMMTWVVNGSLEAHSVKHTRTEALGGPANRVWTASLAWSGSTVVESGIHQLDLMRDWAGDVAWTQARYVHRDASDVEDGGDNPYAYSVAFGFESGMIGNLLLTRLRRAFYSDSYHDIVWDRGHLRFEPEGPVAYFYAGPCPPSGRPAPDDLRHPLAVPPSHDPTRAINQAFVRAVATGDASLLRSDFAGSMNSLAAVLAANVSDRLGGERVSLQEFIQGDRYAGFRRRPGRTETVAGEG